MPVAAGEILGHDRLLEPLGERWHDDLACIHAMAGKPEVALELFGQAIAAGFRRLPRFDQDRRLEPIRGRPEFAGLRARRGRAHRRGSGRRPLTPTVLAATVGRAAQHRSRSPRGQRDRSGEAECESPAVPRL